VAASAITTTRVQGIAVHDPRISEDTLQDIGIAATDSAYTQAGAKPGVPEADQTSGMAFAASGTQADKGDIEIRTQRAGGVGPDRAGFLWRNIAKSEATSEMKGWDGYQAVSGLESLFRNAGTGAGGSLPTVHRLISGKVLMAHQPADASATNVEVQEYDPATQGWTTLASALNLHGVPDTIATVALTQLADGRVLMYAPAASNRNVTCWYSDDDGTTWNAGSFGSLRTDLASGSTINEIRVAANGTQVLLLVQYNDGANEQLGQFASTEDGTRFDLVKAAWDVSGDEPDAFDVTALRGGSFLVVYHDGQASSPVFHTRRIGSAFETMENAEILNSTSAGEGDRGSVALWEDEDGVVYLLTGQDNGSSFETVLTRSTDQGNSWSAYGGPIAELSPGAQTAELNEFACTSTGGLGLLVTRYTGNGDAEDNSALVCIYLGGHGTHTLPATDEDVGGASVVNFPDTSYIAWSQSNDNGKKGGLYLSVEEPANVGWTAAGAGTDAITSSQRLHITTSAAARSYARTTTDATLTSAMAECEIEINGTDGDETTKEIALELVLSDYDGTPASATYTYKVSLRFAYDRFRLYDDNAGTSVAEVAIDNTVPHLFRVILDQGGNVRTFYCKPGPQIRDWTAGPTTGSLTNTTADVGNEIEWGHIASGTAQSDWTHVGYCFWGAGWNNAYPIQTNIAGAWNNPLYLHTRSVPAYPVLVHGGVRIQGTNGPAFQGETWRIKPEHTYAITNILPQSNPSPRRGWRNVADNLEQLIVFDIASSMTSARLMNHSVFIGVFESNLETVVIETYDGATWNTLGTLTSTEEWDSLQYDQRGRTLIPRQGVSTTGERYLWYAAHVGDTVDLGTGAPTTDYHKVKRNTEGAWLGATTTKKPTLLLESSPAGNQSFGTMKIRRKDFGLVVHSYNDDDYLLRLRIPAQHTADDDYRIGQIFVGHVAAFGQDYDRGWSVSREWDTEVLRRTGGTRRGRKRGPSRRVVEVAWADAAVDSSRVQDTSPDPNYLIGQTSVDLAIGTPFDVVQLVEGVTEEAGGPETPVVYLSRIPTDASADHPITDPRLMVYGRIESDHRLDNVLGDEGKTELNRSGTLTVREEK
jgi:hypothetical protein